MVIDIKELFQYMNCPLSHYFQHIKGIPNRAPNSKELYNDCIESVIRSFYYSLMDEKFLNPHDIKMKWQAACSNYSYDIDSESVKTGLQSLLQFHDWAKESCGVGFDINREYLMPIGEDKLHGTLPIVRQKFDKTIDILHLKHWNATVDTFKIETDIAFPLSMLAFNHIYKSLPDSITVYNCKTGKEIMLRFTADDVVRSQAIVSNIFDSLRANIKYPKWNIYCNGCNYKAHCKGWRG